MTDLTTPSTKKRVTKRETFCACRSRIKAGKIIGVIQALNKQAGAFNKTDEQRLKAFAAQASIAIENATLFEGIVDVKNHNERILESMSNGVITVDPGGEIASANMAALRLFRAENNVGKVLHREYNDFFGPDNDWIIQMIKKVSRTRKQDIALNSELILVKKGDVVEHERRRKFATVNLTVIPLQATGREDLLGCMLVLEDITTEKAFDAPWLGTCPKK